MKFIERPILLGVNIDHVATLRQARGTRYPDPLEAAIMAERGGADGITVHLREDRRHIQDRDVEMLKGVIQTRLNLEMAATDAMIDYAKKIRPQHCCLVPERREELTTEGGLDVVKQEARMSQACDQLNAVGIQVSLFIDPDIHQVDAAVRCGAPVIEIHTGRYAEAKNESARQHELKIIVETVNYALNAGLIVNAGHGLHYHNVQDIASITGIHELNIGHGIVARAIFVGFHQAVYEMKHLMQEARLLALHDKNKIA